MESDALVHFDVLQLTKENITKQNQLRIVLLYMKDPCAYSKKNMIEHELLRLNRRISIYFGCVNGFTATDNTFKYNTHSIQNSVTTFTHPALST